LCFSVKSERRPEIIIRTVSVICRTFAVEKVQPQITSNMKKLITIATMLLGLMACSEQKQVATEGVTREQISFPIGDRIDNSAFTGDAYLKPLINVDSVFNFPQANVVTVGPGAHSSWHRHGGMVVLVTDGVGLYQEEGK